MTRHLYGDLDHDLHPINMLMCTSYLLHLRNVKNHLHVIFPKLYPIDVQLCHHQANMSFFHKIQIYHSLCMSLLAYPFQ